MNIIEKNNSEFLGYRILFNIYVYREWQLNNTTARPLDFFVTTTLHSLFPSPLVVFWALVYRKLIRSSVTIMVNLKVEQHINPKFLVKLKKSTTECFEILMMVMLYHIWVFLNSTNEYLKVGKCLNMTYVPSDLWLQEMKKSSRMIAEIVNINKEIVKQILHDELQIINMLFSSMTREQGINRCTRRHPP